jgi:hypothetical protein
MSPRRARFACEVFLATVGVLALWLVSPDGPRPALSFLGGFGIVIAAFEFGAFNVRLAARVSARVTLLVALLSYAVTVVTLGLALVAASPRVVSGWAVAAGLLVGIVVWLTGELAATWVRAGHRETRP